MVRNCSQSVRKVLFTYAMCSIHGIIYIMYVLSCQTIVHVLHLLRMVALPLVLDQPWLEHTSTTTVIVGYKRVGDFSRMCKIGAIWTGNTPTCVKSESVFDIKVQIIHKLM